MKFSLSLSTLHPNIASLSRQVEDLHNFLSILKHSFELAGITEHKINEK